VGLEWVCGLLQPGFVRWAPPPLLHKTTLTTTFIIAFHPRLTVPVILKWGPCVGGVRSRIFFGTRAQTHDLCDGSTLLQEPLKQWLKWGDLGGGGSAPCSDLSHPAMSLPRDWIYKVLFLYPNNAKLVGCWMGMGFAPTWLRQSGESPPRASHDHFNHCSEGRGT